jgi:hypothetical protein
MRFNQVNKNNGDVNNAFSEKGNVVQSIGDRNKVEVTQPVKQRFWSMLWGKAVACWRWLTGHGS